MAAPGTPKACVTPSFSITSTAAIAAFILAMLCSLCPWAPMVPALAARGRPRPAYDPFRHGINTGITVGCAMDRFQAMQIFVRVVETGSFSKAAAELGTTQPTATKAVAEAERHLGARLLHRSTRGVTPTEAGALYYERCKAILREVEDAESLAGLAQAGSSGTLRINSSVAFGRRVLIPLVLRYMAEHPGLQIDLASTTSTSTWSSRGWTWPSASAAWPTPAWARATWASTPGC
jgi:molybdenum-dependent DNA-binding transcriptional regulator ModE